MIVELRFPPAGLPSSASFQSRDSSNVLAEHASHQDYPRNACLPVALSSKTRDADAIQAVRRAWTGYVTSLPMGE